MTTNMLTEHQSKLTDLEIEALPSDINVADGHARQELTAYQRDIIAQLPQIFYEATERPPTEFDQRAKRAFLTALGQYAAPIDEGRVLSCYASSVAMEILARSMASSIRTVALIHPTFDNIPDILKGVGLDLMPVGEECLMEGTPSEVLAGDVESLFITTPNNPTGAVLPSERLRLLAHECASREVVLVLDTSFRGFDVRAQYDSYAILERSGVRYVIIEDTGKLWPTLDVKVGLLVFSANVGLPIRTVYSDILLGVSPFVLAVIERFARDASSGGLERLHLQVQGNRSRLRSALASRDGVMFPDPCSRVSVERLQLSPGTSATQVWAALRQRSVHVLPCRSFYWAAPEQGDRFVRIALARPPEVVDAAVDALLSVLGM